ncbi:MAG TPA: DUF2155 domain-containing protein [Xanthobacteraceae bacterium]
MRRIRFRCVALVVTGMAAGVAPAAAQFGGIFDPPPRPPSNVPNRPPAQIPPPPVEQQRVINPPRAPSPGAGGGTVPIQSQSLPPPPGVPADPAAVPPAQPGQPPNQPPNQAPDQRQPRGAPLPANAGPQPANTAPQPGDEVVAPPPTQKIINPTAVFSGLDKITGRITSFDVAINETVQFGALQVTPRVCYTRPPTETPNTDSFVEVDEVTLQGEVKRIFTGWMFAASPGLHGVEHPIYDVWLTDCKGGASAAPVADAQPTPPPAPPPAPGRTTTPQRQAPPRPRAPGPPR